MNFKSSSYPLGIRVVQSFKKKKRENNKVPLRVMQVMTMFCKYIFVSLPESVHCVPYSTITTITAEHSSSVLEHSYLCASYTFF